MRISEFLNENLQTKLIKLRKMFPTENVFKLERLASESEKKGVDLFKYRTVKQMEDFLNSLEKSTAQKKREGRNMLFENAWVRLYRIDNFQACYSFGSSTHFCITDKDFWNEYKEKGVTFYFVFVKNARAYTDRLKRALALSMEGGASQKTFKDKINYLNSFATQGEKEGFSKEGFEIIKTWAIAVYPGRSPGYGLMELYDENNERYSLNSEGLDAFVNTMGIPKALLKSE